MRYACKLCICLKGIKHESLSTLPATLLEAREHVEKEHGHLTVRSPETYAEARARFIARWGHEPKTALEILRAGGVDPALAAIAALAIEYDPVTSPYVAPEIPQ